MVKSFKEAGLEYSVAVDTERNWLLSCTCPDYVKNTIPCKHMYLVARLFDISKIRYTPDHEQLKPRLENVNSNEGDDRLGHGAMEDNIPPIPADFPLNVQMLLQAERAKEWEAKKRKHEEEVAEAFKEYEGRLKDVWVKMSG